MEFEKIRDVIAEQMSVPKDSITMETNIRADLNADSLDEYQIVSDLEEVFGMEFDNDDAGSIKTVGDAVEFVKKALNS